MENETGHNGITAGLFSGGLENGMIDVIPKTLLYRAKYPVLQRDTAGLNQPPLYGSKNRINLLKINVSVNK